MAVELMDLETANLIASYSTTEEALQLVREAIQRHGRDYVQTWALGDIDRTTPPIVGNELAQLAMRPVGA